MGRDNSGGRRGSARRTEAAARATERALHLPYWALRLLYVATARCEERERERDGEVRDM